MSSVPAGWLPDPGGKHGYRYWDGQLWTDQVSNAGSQEADQLTEQPAAPTAQPAPAPSQPSAIQPWSSGVRIAVFGGAAMLALGSLLTWVKASAGIITATKAGTDGDGILTLIFAGLVALLFWLIKSHRPAAIATIVLGVLAGAIAIYDIGDISNKADSLGNQTIPVHASVGIGLILCAIAAAVVVIGGIMAVNESKATTS